MEELSLEVELTEIQKIKKGFFAKVRKHLGAWDYKAYIMVGGLVLALIFYAFVGMETSDNVVARYGSYIAFFGWLPLCFFVDFLVVKGVTKHNAKVTAGGEGPKTVNMKFTPEYIELSTVMEKNTYNRSWMKYICLYENNLAVLSYNYSAIIVPEKYLSEDIRDKLLSMYSFLEKIDLDK